MCDSVIPLWLLHLAMKINTSRFGPLEIDAVDVILFPQGLLGLEECRRWVLLADASNANVAWMQSVERPEVALATVSPRRFVPSFRMRVARRELALLELADLASAKVLVVVGKRDQAVTLNLKAPLVINIERSLGRQVITNGDLPIRHHLDRYQTDRYQTDTVQPTLRRSA